MIAIDKDTFIFLNRNPEIDRIFATLRNIYYIDKCKVSKMIALKGLRIDLTISPSEIPYIFPSKIPYDPFYEISFHLFNNSCEIAIRVKTHITKSPIDLDSEIEIIFEEYQDKDQFLNIVAYLLKDSEYEKG